MNQTQQPGSLGRNFSQRARSLAPRDEPILPALHQFSDKKLLTGNEGAFFTELLGTKAQVSKRSDRKPQPIDVKPILQN
jgi:hypothetical protein